MSAAGITEPIEFQLPRRVIRKLLRGPWFRRARHVLVVANGCADVVRLLDRSGARAAGIDDSAGNNQEPGQVHFGSVAGGFPFPPQAFDLVLLGPCRAFEQGLKGPEPLIAMANLLSSLKTRGRLVWLNTIDAPHPGGEEPATGLSQFAGDVTVSDYHDGWERFLSLEWLLGRHRHIRLQLTTLTVPRKPISRLNWHQLARDAALGRLPARSHERAA